MAHQCRRVELKPIEQLAVIDNQIEPAVEDMHRFMVAAAGAGMAWRINRIRAGEPGEKHAVGTKTPWPVQIDKRRPTAADLDLCFDLALPQPQPAHLRSPHGASPPILRRRRPWRRR